MNWTRVTIWFDDAAWRLGLGRHPVKFAISRWLYRKAGIA